MIRPIFYFILLASVYLALGYAFLTLNLLPLVIALVAIITALAGKEVRRVEP